MSNASADPHTSPRLSPWDGISIIIGIVIGVSIFETPPMIYSNVASPLWVAVVWVAGGLLSLIGALCYAELTTTYPQSGGDYVYLKRAYGNWVGFLFGWAQLVAILTGSIGAMAYVFSDYAVRLWSLNPAWQAWLAAGVVTVLAIINLGGVIVEKTVQNLLTIAKLLGVACIAVAGLVWGGHASLIPKSAVGGGGIGMAMIFVLYSYGGWNDAAFVASEVRDRRRNLPRVLLIGTGSIMIIYLLVNAGYLWGLGFEGVRQSHAPAADVLHNALGHWASTGMSVLVMISACGAVNGMIYTGSRVYASLGTDHRVFAALGRWHPRWNVPVWSIVLPAAVSLCMIFAVGTDQGRALVDRSLTGVGLPALPWKEYFGGFSTLVAGTAPVFWLFFLLTGYSVFILRIKDPHVPRSFSVPFFPWTPIVFCLTCSFMLFSSLSYAKYLSLLGFIPLLTGLPLYFLSRKANVDSEPSTICPTPEET
jgi:APA family basic amino acid/polyamine antiporter